MIKPNEIFSIIIQTKHYDGGYSPMFQNLKTGNYPCIGIITTQRQTLKNLQERELGFYIQLGTIGHSVAPTMQTFNNSDGTLAAIIFYWGGIAIWPVEVLLDGVNMAVSNQLGVKSGIVINEHEIDETGLTGDTVQFTMPSVVPYPDDINRYVFWDGQNSAFDATSPLRLIKGGSLWIIAGDFPIGGYASPVAFASLKSILLKRNGVPFKATDAAIIGMNHDGAVIPSGYMYNKLSVQSSQMTFYRPDVIGVNRVQPVGVEWVFVAQDVASAATPVITTNLPGVTLVVTAGSGPGLYNVAMHLNGDIPADNSGFISIDDAVLPAYDATLTLTVTKFPGMSEFVGSLDHAVDVNIPINRVFADGFTACGTAAIASMQQNNLNTLPAGQTLVTIPSQVTNGDWYNSVPANKYVVYNVMVNGNVALNAQIVTIGARKIRVLLHQCI